MVISKRTNNTHQNTTSSISQSNHHQQHQQSDRKLKALKNCSKWNSALLHGRRSRGPQWDYSTASYHIARNSIAYFTGVTPLDQSNSSDLNPSNPINHQLSIQPHQLNQNLHSNQHKQSSPYLSQPPSASQSHSINPNSTQLHRSSSFHQPILRPQLPSPHPNHQIQPPPFQVGIPKPLNTINDPKFGPFVSVSNNHPHSNLIAQSNLSTHSGTGTIGPPSSHFSSGSVSSSSGAHPPGPLIGNRPQISPTGIPMNEQNNESNPELSHDQSNQELNISRHSSIDRSHSQINPPPPPPAPIRSNPELGINPPQAYSSFHPSEPSPQFQTQPQTNHIQYPPHLIPPPTSPDKPTNQPSPSTNEHPAQVSPIPSPTAQDQSSPTFRPPNQWSPNSNYNPSSIPYPPTHQHSPQFNSSQQFSNQNPTSIHKQTLGATSMKPVTVDSQHHPYQSGPSSTPNSATRPIFSPHPHSYPHSSYASPSPSSALPPPPNPNFKTVASFSGISNPENYKNLQQIQQQQQAQIAIKNQQAQLIASKVKQQQPPPPISSHPQNFQPPPHHQSQHQQPPPPPTGYHNPGGYLKATGQANGSIDGFGNPMGGFGVPYMGYNPTKSMPETGVGNGELRGNESVSPDGT